MTHSNSKDWPVGWAPPPADEELVFFLEEPVESDYHRDLAALLIQLLRFLLGRTSYVGGNQAVYFSELQVRNRDFLAPDVFAVVGETTDEQRLGWVVWKEGGRGPDLIVEILSPSTEEVDRGKKRRIYERLLHVSEYFLFDPATGALEGLRLGEGGYREISPVDGRLRSEVLDGWLAPIEGTYQGRSAVWVRLFDAERRLVPTEEERTQQAQAEAERAQAEAERAQAEARALAERLAALEARLGPLGEG